MGSDSVVSFAISCLLFFDIDKGVRHVISSSQLPRMMSCFVPLGRVQHLLAFYFITDISLLRRPSHLQNNATQTVYGKGFADTSDCVLFMTSSNSGTMVQSVNPPYNLRLAVVGALIFALLFGNLSGILRHLRLIWYHIVSSSSVGAMLGFRLGGLIVLWRVLRFAVACAYRAKPFLNTQE